MGLAPASDVEPILEAIPDGAEAVSTGGRGLYANTAFAELTSVRPMKPPGRDHDVILSVNGQPARRPVVGRR